MIKWEDTTMKKIYIQPQVIVASIALQSNLLAGSPAPAGNSMNLNTGIPTDEQW